MEELFHLMLHADEHIAEIVVRYGILTYFILFAIIFIETGLVVVTFFPGDGLLFSAGMLAATGHLKVAALLVLLSLATIAGNTSNYLIGRLIGTKYFKKEKAKRSRYLSKAYAFFEKHEGKAVFVSRFIPFMRSFVPFVAGITSMHAGLFTSWNAAGGVLWITVYVLAGFFFGEIPWVREYYGLIFSLMLIFLLVSVVAGALRFLFRKS